jgi:hypothetical protein
VLHNIFAIELCLRIEPGSGLRDELKELILTHPDASTPGLKWELLRDASRLLAKSLHLVDRGCWDFFDDDGRALRDYDMWSKGMTTEEGARKEPSGAPGSDGEPRFMTFTCALLLRAHSPSVRRLSDLCDIPEPDLWRRSTFARILGGLTCVSFAAVKSDIFYLIPGDASWGLTAEDLEQEKFAYFRKVL